MDKKNDWRFSLFFSASPSSLFFFLFFFCLQLSWFGGSGGGGGGDGCEGADWTVLATASQEIFMVQEREVLFFLLCSSVRRGEKRCKVQSGTV